MLCIDYFVINVKQIQFMFFLANVIWFVQTCPFLQFRPPTHSKKSWDSTTFTKVAKMYQSTCKHVLKCATVQGYRHILHAVCIGERSIQHSDQYLCPLPPQPCFCNKCIAWFYTVLLKNAWKSVEKQSSWRQYMLHIYFSILMLSSQKCKWA